ncbi:MAG: APC family permease [Acidimicrobiia bacterium]
MGTEVVASDGGGSVESKGLKAGALGLASATVVGVASTAPGYSIAASLGLVTYAVGFQAPAIMWVSFIPMACIAAAFFYLNRADPDCGTNFTWVTRAIGPKWGWMGGWSSMVADLVIMPSLAYIAASYTFQLFGLDSMANSEWWTLALGIVFIMAMTWICVVGIELSARTQMFLLVTELAILVVFSVWALVRVYRGEIPGSVDPSLSWLVPKDFGGISGLTAGLLVAVFLYWGWDTAVSVNEECEDANRTPGVAAVLSTVILVGIYVIVAFAAQAVKGADFLSSHSDDVLAATGSIIFGSSAAGTLFEKLLIIAVLSSAAASCQTTILPAARTALSMSTHRAFPPRFGEIDRRHLTPARATWVYGIVSSIWFAVLVIASHLSDGDVLGWSVASVGLMISYYYGQTGIACAVYYRRYLFTSVKNFFLVGVLPLTGGVILGWVFIQSVWDMTNRVYTDPPQSWLGVSPVLWLGLGVFLGGIPVMFWWRSKDRTFFDRGTDDVESRPPPEGGEPLPPLVASERA